LDEARELLRGLKVSVDAPETVRSGSTLAYRVTLTNTTTSPIPLDICPMYTQALRVGEVGSATPATHFLNCAAVGGSIPAGKSVTFEMRYLVDEGLNPAEGQWRVQWGFEGGLDLPYGSSPVVLEPAA
jgi:hypothetical protein